MKLVHFLLITLLCLLLAINCFAAGPGTLNDQLAELTNQIASNITDSSNKTKIAVMEFSDLKGNVTEFGKFISEELTTRLFMTKKFDVVERELLGKVLKEHKFNQTGIVDSESAIELGRILGVNAIVSGTITDLGDTVKLNSRMIAAETGSLFAVAAVEIIKDKSIITLMEHTIETEKELPPSPTSSIGPLPGQTPSPSPTTTVQPEGNIIYFEDFSKPINWPIFANQTSSRRIVNGAYEIAIFKQKYLSYNAIPLKLSDKYQTYKIGLDLRISEGNSGDYGIFLIKSKEEYYIFRIDPFTKRYALGYEKEKYLKVLVPWTSCSAIEGPNGTNLLSFYLLKNRIKVHLNQQFVFEYYIESLVESGFNTIHLYSRAETDIPLKTYFDNIIISYE